MKRKVIIKTTTTKIKTGDLAAEVCINEKTEQVVITSKHGQIIKLPVKGVPNMGRSTQGVILMRFAKSDDMVAAATTLEKEIEEDNNSESSK